MKKKAIVIIILTIIFILTIFIGFKIFNKKSNIESNNIKSESNTNIATNDTNIELPKEYLYDIKSTENNRIEKDGIEAENIQIHTVESQTEFTATIKNNSQKTLNGYFIEIKLLDENNNELTVIAENSDDIIKPNESKEFVSYVNGLEQSESIKNAVISVLEPHNIE